MYQTYKVLITVKTYPSLSLKYEETVCTAGLLQDGSWIRIYPIAFRVKDYEEKYRKYHWIEIDLEKNKNDCRPESYRPYSSDSKIKIVGNLDTTNNWQARKDIVLQDVDYDLSKLIGQAKNKGKKKSLATFKPSEIVDFIAEPSDSKDYMQKKEQIIAKRKQISLLKEREDLNLVEKLPFDFKYIFKDSKGKESKMKIIDWELGALFWRQFKKYGDDEKKAKDDVIKKYLSDFVKTKDLYFFLGTTQLHHFNSKNPFLILGTFTPKIDRQLKLF